MNEICESCVRRFRHAHDMNQLEGPGGQPTLERCKDSIGHLGPRTTATAKEKQKKVVRARRSAPQMTLHHTFLRSLLNELRRRWRRRPRTGRRRCGRRRTPGRRWRRRRPRKRWQHLDDSSERRRRRRWRPSARRQGRRRRPRLAGQIEERQVGGTRRPPLHGPMARPRRVSAPVGELERPQQGGRLRRACRGAI